MNWVYVQIFVRNIWSVLRSLFYINIEPAFNLIRYEGIEFVDILF